MHYDIRQLQAFVQEELPQETLTTLLPKLNSDINDRHYGYELHNAFKDFITLYKLNRITIIDYYEAVKFITFVSMGDTIVSSYLKTFDPLYLLDKRTLKRKSTAYSNRKIIQEMRKTITVPLYLLHTGLVDQAIKKAVHLMNNADTDAVRLQAAKLILDKLVIPEEQQVNIRAEFDHNITIGSVSPIEELKATLTSLTKQMTDNGSATVGSIQDVKIIPKEASSIADLSRKM